MAEIDALTHIYEPGTRFIATDKTIIKTADGVHAPAALKTRQAAYVATLGATTNLTAIGATFADLAAARTAVNTLATETEARLDGVEAKVEAIRAALVAAGLMAAS